MVEYPRTIVTGRNVGHGWMVTQMNLNRFFTFIVQLNGTFYLLHCIEIAWGGMVKSESSVRLAATKLTCVSMNCVLFTAKFLNCWRKACRTQLKDDWII